MKHIKLTSWEVNIILVGLDHIKDEIIENESQEQDLTNLYIELKGFLLDSVDDKMDFPVKHQDIVLLSMATTEIFLLHNDLTKFGENDTKFSLDIVKQCQNIINKLMKG